MALLGNLAILLVFAWAVRGLLGAREVTWGRTLTAAVVGALVGATLAGLLVIDPTELADGTTEAEAALDNLAALALPFQIVATMVALVGFELLLARPRGRRGWRHPLAAAITGGRNLRRGLQVSRILARHGLAPVLGLRRGPLPARDPAELARRARLAIEDAGGVFVKLGQLLATRPDLLPPAALAELGELHATARPLGWEVIEPAIAAELGVPLDQAFAELRAEPLGSASIAQVHAGRLHDGREVVAKLRRPGLEPVVDRDLRIVAWLARVAQRRTAWGRTLGVEALAAEFSASLRRELDLRLEGRDAAEIAVAAGDTPSIRVPAIVAEHTTERLLVMERLRGTPLSSLGAPGSVPDATALADELCTSQVRAMLQGGRFHGDPHPGNVLVLDDGTLGLIDFGVTGKLDAFERSSMLQLLVAVHLEEPALLHESLVAVGAVDPAADRDAIERELARFLAIHLGPELPPADALLDLLRLLGDLGIRLPAPAATMFRALATLAGTLEQLAPGYPLIDRIAALGGAELEDRASPTSMGELVQREWAQLGPLVRRAPRQLDRLATMLTHGTMTTRVRLFAEPDDVAVAEGLVNRVVLTAIALGVALLSVIMLGTDTGVVLAGTDLRLLEVLGWFGLFSGTVLLLRVLLQVLRS